jgi:hypothetical protein
MLCQLVSHSVPLALGQSYEGEQNVFTYIQLALLAVGATCYNCKKESVYVWLPSFRSGG